MGNSDSKAGDEPFRIMLHDGITVVDYFRPEIRNYAGMERELPVVRDAVAKFVDAGRTRFIFDLRTVDPCYEYPIAKWGAMYGAMFGLRRREPSNPETALRRNIKLVASGEHLVELRWYQFDQVFECFDTLA
jgi:hypothetical protein